MPAADPPASSRLLNIVKNAKGEVLSVRGTNTVETLKKLLHQWVPASCAYPGERVSGSCMLERGSCTFCYKQHHFPRLQRARPGVA